MKMKNLAWMVILCGGLSVGATEVAPALQQFQKACAAAGKKAATCGCISENLKLKVQAQEYAVEKIQEATQAIHKTAAAGEENLPISEALSDFLAGLEIHCAKKPNYTYTSP
ncbi:MAG TPA: hypothetical protein PKC28_00555 [Bdellovibrionales bacterium]|nr:hypothetical protein [Bdellovibrionales bacterium]